MSIEKAKATDTVGGGLIANTGSSEGAKATGRVHPLSATTRMATSSGLLRRPTSW
jgi:hypothetical protein